MSISIDEKVKAYGRMPRLQAYDILATFGDGQLGRIKRLLLDKNGKFHLDEQAWEAGEVAYQSLKQLYPLGITEKEFTDVAMEFYSMACNDIFPDVLSLAEAGKIEVRPGGVAGMKSAWEEYDWCERLMFAVDFIDDLKANGATFDNPLNTALPLVLLQRLDDAVISEFLDGRGISTVLFEVATLKDRLQPPKHVRTAMQEVQLKVDSFVKARRKGADAIHAEHRSMKADVFRWLDSQPKFKSIEAAARAITKQQPIAHVTGRDWYKEWKKLRSASTP